MSGPDQTNATIQIDYIEVDMPSRARADCSACDDAKTRLDRAIEGVSGIFGQLGLDVEVRDIRVRTVEEAELLRVRGSPTIRIGVADMFPEHRQGEQRIWHWRGHENAAPPTAMFTQALLKLAADHEVLPLGSYKVPSSLRRFLAEKSFVS